MERNTKTCGPAFVRITWPMSCASAQHRGLVLAAVRCRRRADADQRDLAPENRLPHVVGHRDPAARDDLRHQIDHAFLDDRRPAVPDQGELGRLDVDADDLVAVARETGERHGADVTEAEDADVHALIFHCLRVGIRRGAIVDFRVLPADQLGCGASPTPRARCSNPERQRSMIPSRRCIDLGQE